MPSDLTRQQEAALRAFDGSHVGETSSDSACWLEDVRPWPTMDNLIAKGLVERLAWFGPEDGWEYALTEAGARAREVVLARAE